MVSQMWRVLWIRIFRFCVFFLNIGIVMEEEGKVLDLQSELSTLRRSNAGLRSVNMQRGKKIKELEGRICALHSELVELEERCDKKSSELDALRVTYASLVKDNLRLSKELREERQKSIWQHIFG